MNFVFILWTAQTTFSCLCDTDGDKRNEFYIGRDQGNVLLAKQLDYETQNFYNLTISVSDMVHTVYTQVCCSTCFTVGVTVLL